MDNLTVILTIFSITIYSIYDYLINKNLYPFWFYLTLIALAIGANKLISILRNQRSKPTTKLHSEDINKLAQFNNWDVTMLQELSTKFKSRMYQLRGYEDKIIRNAIVLESDPEKNLNDAEKTVHKHKMRALKTDSDQPGYAILITNIMDDYKILRLLETNGANYDIDTEAIIKKYKQWKKLYKAKMTGASLDWIEFEFDFKFNKQSVEKLAKEIYKFCPDSIEQGFESIERMAEYILENSKIFLWWD